jgi:hypothetical protein
VALPSEHGAWAFLAEPVVLGLLVAGSTAGGLLALSALAVFLARRPLRIALADRRERKRHPRTPVAEGTFVFCAAVAVSAFLVALPRVPHTALVALALGALPGILALRFDLAARSREAAAELAGALALSVAAPGILLVGGRPPGVALGLWVVMAARAVTSIVYVRSRLRLERGEPAGVAAALGAHAVAVLGVAGLAAWGVVPRLGVAAVALLGLRAAYGLSPHRPRMTTRQLGLSEVVFGAITVLALAAGVTWRL